jgi:hypothetical protein
MKLFTFFAGVSKSDSGDGGFQAMLMILQPVFLDNRVLGP